MTVDSSGKGFSLPSGPSSLCFDKDEFMKKDFEVDKFIVEYRKKVPLETLRDDLDLYLKVVKSAMVELINKDYADFVNLSTNLVGMDKAITNLTTPLGQLKEEVLSVQTAMDEAIEAVQGKIKQQQEIRHKKAVLQRLMNIILSVEKIEKLLGIQSGTESAVSPGHLTGPLIERVATEFNKLQFYVTRSKKHPLVDQVKPRIATITTTLQYSLEGSFLSGLESSNTAMLRQCLRTYALIDKIQDAEDLFREHVVRPHMEQIIGEDFLNRHGIDTATMFEQVLTFVPDKCSVLNSITTGTSGDIVRGYDFMVNAVFPEIVRNLEIRTPSIFAPGNPDVFHKKYTIFMRFLDAFEQCCASQTSVKRLRQHASYQSIIGKWNLPVYFQIRFQDIAGSFEVALCSGFNNNPGQSEFRLVAAQSLWSCLTQCWGDGIFLSALAHRFLRLNLQLLSRFKTWLDEIYQEELSRKGDVNNDSKQRSSTPDRFSSPSPTMSSTERSGSPRLIVTSELAPRPQLTSGQIVAIMSDLDQLSSKIPQLFSSFIEPKLNLNGLEKTESVKSALIEGLNAACECKPGFWSIVTEDVIKKCAAYLSQVNDIPRLYRRTKKEVPVKPSLYLAGLLKPLNQFCEEHSAALNLQQRTDFLKHVFAALSQQFAEVTSEVLTSTKKMEDSLRRLKKARGGGAGDKDKEKTAGVSDSDKIRTQIMLDVQAFLQQIEAMGLQPSQVDGYVKITSLAEEAESDMAPS